MSRYIALTLCALVWSTQAFAQSLVVVVGFAPGGTSSTIARILADGLKEPLRKSVIVENKPGAGGIVAAEFVRKQMPGTHLLVVSSSSLTNVPPETLTAVAMVAKFHYVAVVHRELGVRDLAEYLSRAKADEKERLYGSFGANTLAHLMGKELARLSNIPLEVVQFRGAAEAALNVRGRHVPMAILPVPDFLAHQDVLLALAQGGATRTHTLPRVPTFVESGHALEAQGWMGVMVAHGTDPAFVRRLSELIPRIAQEHSAQLSTLGFEAPEATDPVAFGRYHQDEYDRWLAVTRR